MKTTAKPRFGLLAKVVLFLAAVLVPLALVTWFVSVHTLRVRMTEEFTSKQREVALLLDQGSVDMGEAQLRIEHFWAGALRRAVIDGDVETGSLMAGQSVGMVTREQSTAEILGELLEQTLAVIAARESRRRPSAAYVAAAEGQDGGG